MINLFLKTLFISLVFVCSSYACQAWKRGVYVHHDDMIDNAEVIVLVKCTKLKNDDKYHDIATLEVSSSIKGKPKKKYRLGSEKSLTTNTFYMHKDSMFWQTDSGRLPPMLSGMCGPAMAFQVGCQYLLFPDYLGSVKSSELIADTSDEWYKYVVNRVKHGKRQLSSNDILKNDLLGYWYLLEQTIIDSKNGITHKTYSLPACLINFTKNSLITYASKENEDSVRILKEWYYVSYGTIFHRDLLTQFKINLINNDTMILEEPPVLIDSTHCETYKYKWIKYRAILPPVNWNYKKNIGKVVF